MPTLEQWIAITGVLVAASAAVAKWVSLVLERKDRQGAVNDRDQAPEPPHPEGPERSPELMSSRADVRASAVLEIPDVPNTRRMRDILPRELHSLSVFRDEQKLSYDYVPESLPGRHTEMTALARAFKPLLTADSPQHFILHGPVGSGKTALVRRFVVDFKAVAKEQTGKNVEYVLVNCRRRSTESAVLLRILMHFDERFRDRGFSNAEMLEVLKKQLARKEAHLIVILDEADILLEKSGSDLVYNLTRFNESGQALVYGVCLILIGQRDPAQSLDEATVSSFKRSQTITLERYSEEQLLSIVAQRVELAFHADTFPQDVQWMVAEAAAEHGDARYAIELLQKAGVAADMERVDQVRPEHVRAAVAEVHPHVTETKLRGLDRHQQLVLLAIAEQLRAEDSAYAAAADIEQRYALACEEHGEKPRAHTQFWTYLKDLEGLGFIHTKRSGKGVLGTTTLISLPDVPAKVLEEKVTEILGAA